MRPNVIRWQVQRILVRNSLQSVKRPLLCAIHSLTQQVGCYSDTSGIKKYFCRSCYEYLWWFNDSSVLNNIRHDQHLTHAKQVHGIRLCYYNENKWVSGESCTSGWLKSVSRERGRQIRALYRCLFKQIVTSIGRSDFKNMCLILLLQSTLLVGKDSVV